MSIQSYLVSVPHYLEILKRKFPPPPPPPPPPQPLPILIQQERNGPNGDEANAQEAQKTRCPCEIKLFVQGRRKEREASAKVERKRSFEANTEAATEG
jgi:hypothetical protein